ncbi:MAG TPA: cupin domain-containing protein [Chitinophagales bacterium]|nr:cupin domain-containing protein [Chitinophagales bacterium]HMU97807.1 cupin domain-containing protein [Chitinophagales bacterium]HMW94061.1 cupin domain-containing protein [Chitinophagales bacterium]HMY42046.1 cupin domain-containing protein [Chitinophagales bacterium]HMZ67977.1 cupin domain-containing protein [Chitinophagales bacterium]
MNFTEVHKNENYKVTEVFLELGEKMPLHQATSNAFVICRNGKSKLTFFDKTLVLSQGESILIQANDPHELEVLENFSASIIMDPDAKIDFL